MKLRGAGVFFIIFSVLFCFAEPGAGADQCLVSVIKPGNLPHLEILHRKFSERLLASSPCRIYLQSPNADGMSLRNSARKAVAVGSSLIVTYGSSATLAAKYEAGSVPLLFADVYDPASFDLVSAKGFPHQDSSGVRGDAPVQTLLKTFLETTGSKELAILFDAVDPASALQANSLKEIASRKGFSVVLLPVHPDRELLAAFEGLKAGVGGVLLVQGGRVSIDSDKIYALARDKRIPIISQGYGAADHGCLISLETDPLEQGELLADMALNVINGETPRQIRMVLPKKVSLVVNLRVAEQLGLKVPFDVLSMVTRVVR